ncbi:MAG: HAD family hydrolase [Deltaproteobacteria bacterium]|jgi:HAD superfamily hydrolase (TIGR01509 family)|nr:HAD family hydrolase [Deltaproteobacteria bacterium]
MLKALIFDLDMTLVDSLDACAAGVDLLAKRFNLKRPNKDQVLKAISLPIAEFWRQLWGEVRPEWGDYMYKVVIPQVIGQTKVYPAAPIILGEAKKKGLLLGLATNRANPWLDLAALDLAKFFDTAVGASDVPRAKPEPDILLTVIRQLGVDSSTAIYVGDALSDMACARSAGIKAVGLTQGGHSPEALSKAGADLIRENLAACRDVLDF